MGMTKKEYIDQLIVDEIAEKVANEPMEDMIDDLDSDMDSVPEHVWVCLLYTSPSPRDATLSRFA